MVRSSAARLVRPATIHQPLTEKTLVTAYGTAIGTLAYMSPEPAEMSNLDVDTRADIYSLGVMLYELMVGELPVDPGTMGPVAFMAQLVMSDTEPQRPSTRLSTPRFSKDLASSAPPAHVPDLRLRSQDTTPP